MLNDEIRFTRDELHLEEPELCVNGIQFVDDRADLFILLLDVCSMSSGRVARERKQPTSITTWPMMCLYGKYSAFRLIWAAKKFINLYDS